MRFFKKRQSKGATKKKNRWGKGQEKGERGVEGGRERNQKALRLLKKG